jgi:hypothetical protein
MSIRNEGQHPGEFIVSLANHSRSKEQGLIEAGTELLDGTPVNEVGGYLVAATSSTVKGILIGSYNLSSDDEDTKVAYVARDAEVKEELLNLPTDGTQATNVKTGLAGLGIVLR